MAKGLNAKRTGRTIRWAKCSECDQMVFESSIVDGICKSCHQAHVEVVAEVETVEVETGYYNNTEPEMQEAVDDNWEVF